MRYLLDTHAFLWFINDAPELSQQAKSIIEDGSHELELSIASIWEMAIKVSIGKLSIQLPFATFIEQQLQINQIRTLAIAFRHAAYIATMPPHHRDPFDRLIIAQAQIEQIPIIGVDAVFDTYGVTRIW